MAISFEKILDDTRKLSSRLKEYEKTGDDLLNQANLLNKTVETMKEYHEDIQALSSVSQHRPRSSLILTIQRESKQLNELKHENRELKCALDEYQFALELIMSKYRDQITQLIKSHQGERVLPVHVNDASVEIIKRQADKISEMVSIMRKSAEIDDVNHSRDKALLVQLQLENNGLRELLSIAKHEGSIASKKSITNDESTCATNVEQTKQLEEKEVQTDLTITDMFVNGFGHTSEHE